MTGRLSLLAVLLSVGLTAPVWSQPPLFVPPEPARKIALPQSAQIPVDSLPKHFREEVRSVLERPSLSAKGPAETFNTDVNTYHWLLDHPELTVKLWRAQGSKVAEIEKNGTAYRWTDEHGSEVNWYTAARLPGAHIWYAEGKVKAGVLVPTTAFRAVLVLHFVEGKDRDNKPAIQHQVHFIVRCDSRAIALATRIYGASAPRTIEQYLGQLQMFYGGMAWYLSQNEDRARRLYMRIGLALPAESRPITPTRTP